MSLGVIAAIAILTYSSRAIALVLMPKPSERITTVLDRIPAPLFASLAVTSLVDDGSLVAAETAFATAGALLASPTRSLLWVLVGGAAGYGVGALILG